MGTLTEEQRKAVHMALHIFPGSTLITKEGDVPLVLGKRADCPECNKKQEAKMIRVLLLISFLLISGCRLGNDGDDADRSRVLSLDQNVQNSDVSQSVIPEAPSLILAGLGFATLFATSRRWRL